MISSICRVIYSRAIIIAAMLPLGVCGSPAQTPANGPTEFFKTHIRPIFATHCYPCHAASQLGGLRLDSPEALTKGGKSGPVVIAGKPSISVLMLRVKDTHPARRMPLGGSLAQSEVDDLEKWILTSSRTLVQSPTPNSLIGSWPPLATASAGAEHSLDVARYGEDDVRGAVPAGYEPYENAFRYRDWVIQAFNDDMPYDLFVKSQLAAGLLNRPGRDKLMPGIAG